MVMVVVMTMRIMFVWHYQGTRGYLASDELFGRCRIDFLRTTHLDSPTGPQGVLISVDFCSSDRMFFFRNLRSINTILQRDHPPVRSGIGGMRQQIISDSFNLLLWHNHDPGANDLRRFSSQEGNGHCSTHLYLCIINPSI